VDIQEKAFATINDSLEDELRQKWTEIYESYYQDKMKLNPFLSSVKGWLSLHLETQFELIVV
jgi:hypothetical protein